MRAIEWASCKKGRHGRCVLYDSSGRPGEGGTAKYLCRITVVDSGFQHQGDMFVAYIVKPMAP